MTTKQLMNPRVMVIAPWPFMYEGIKKGDIFIKECDYFSASSYYESLKSPFHSILSKDVETCNSNFKPLKWYEHRELSDLPEYILFKSKNYHYIYNIPPNDYLNKEFMKSKFGSNTISNWLPATKEEYEQKQLK